MKRKNKNRSGARPEATVRDFEAAAFMKIFQNAKPGTTFTVGSSANMAGSAEFKQVKAMAEAANNMGGNADGKL